MSTPTENNQTLIDRLFKAGAHFGFTKSRRHPSAKPYLYGNKLGTDILDLTQTADLVNKAAEVLKTAGADGKTVLWVSTKEETSKLVLAEAERIESPYVTNRWIGGMLTNFSEIKKRIDRLARLTEEGASGELERKYTKKERVVLGREAEKLNFNFGGIKTIERPPAAMVVVDPRHDHIAVSEARELNIPIIGIMSSDNNNKLVTYPIIVNDALQASVSVVLHELATAYQTGKAQFVPKTPRTPERRPRPRHTT